MRIGDLARALVLQYLPTRAIRRLKSLQLRRKRKALEAHPPLGEAELGDFLETRLEVARGRTVFVHSSVDLLHLSFSPLRLLQILQERVGPEGTLLFPSFPIESTYEVLRKGTLFDVRRTPGGTGLLGELARRSRGALRSLHPTRSVVGIGPRAAEILAGHEESPFPFAPTSPYGRLQGADAIIVGLGVSTKNLTYVHALDDALPERLPFSPYASELFLAPCRDAEGRDVVVPTYSHDQARMRFNVPSFVRRHFDPSVAEDLSWRGMDFFRVRATPFFARLVELANQGITIYSD